MAFVAVGAEDETNSIVVVPGANFELRRTILMPHSSTTRECSSASSRIPVSSDDAAGAGARGGRRGLRLRPEHGARAAGGVDDALLRAASIVCPNEVELALLAGANEKATAATVAGAVCAAKDLQRRRAKCVLATLGGNGSLLVEGDYLVLFMCQSSLAASTPLDTVRARVRLLYRRLRRREVLLIASTLAAVRAASVVAARSVRGRGARTFIGGVGPDLENYHAVEIAPPRRFGAVPRPARTGRSRGDRRYGAMAKGWQARRPRNLPRHLELANGRNAAREDRAATPLLRPGLAERPRTAPLCVKS